MSSEEIIHPILIEILNNLFAGEEMENVHETSVNSDDLYEFPAEVPNASGDQIKTVDSERKVQSQKRDHEVPEVPQDGNECLTEDTSLYDESKLLKKPILEEVESPKEGTEEHKKPNYDVLPPITMPGWLNGPAPKVGLSRNAKLKPLHKRRRIMN